MKKYILKFIDFLRKIIPQNIRNKKLYVVSHFYSILYGRPSRKLKVIGVTGTDGKTTTSTLMYHILKEAGFNTGLITTISAKIGDEEFDTGFHTTNPRPSSLYKFLKRMVDNKTEYVVLETTSHGLDQYRNAGVKYHSAIFTNVTHEHLDYHKSYDEYLNTKAKLINLISEDGFVVINRDDRSYEQLFKKAKDTGVKVYTYGFTKEADLYASDLQDNIESTKFTVMNDIKYEAVLNLPGEYNVYNALGAISVATVIGIPDETIQAALPKVKSLEGRWQVMQKSPVKVVVDFAHTPNALDKMLQFAKQDNKDGRVIVVFGSAGKRDISKRPLMGEAAGKWADITILTTEDPRGENVENINRQVAVGLQQEGKVENQDYFSIIDRREAIMKALEIAKEGDTVVISGKGHEKSLNIDGINEIHWSDQEVVTELLEEMK